MWTEDIKKNEFDLEELLHEYRELLSELAVSWEDMDDKDRRLLGLLTTISYREQEEMENPESRVLTLQSGSRTLLLTLIKNLGG